MLEATGSIQESGLDPCSAPGSCISFIWWWWWLDIVLAVQPEPLDDLDRVLLMFIRVSVGGLKERR